MKLKPLLWLFPALCSFLIGQASYSGAITSKYAESANDFNFSEHILEGRMNLGSWSGWGQFELSEPPEMGVDLSGFRKLRLEYFGENLSIELGDVYTIWGRGLILNQVDDQAIDLDTGVRGLLFGYMRESFTINLISGKMQTWKSSPVIEEFSDRVPNDLDLRHNFAGAYGELSHELFDAFVEVAYRSSSGEGGDAYLSDGTGVYAGIGTYLGDWSAVIDYKNYDFRRLPPDRNFDFVNNVDISQDFQRPPTGVYLHTSRLIGRIIHELDLNDEVGTQIQLTGPVKEWFTLTVNHSRASRHDVVSMNERYQWNPQTKDRLISSGSPFADYFRDTFIQIEGSLLSEKVQYKLAWDKLDDVLSILTNLDMETATTKSYEMVSAQTFPLDLSIQLPLRFSLEIKAEYQSLRKGYMNDFGDGMEFRSLYPVDTKYNSVISLGLARSPKWSVAYTIDRTSRKWNNKTWKWGPKEWRALELLFNVTENARLSVMTGSQQGGLLCSNGVCRYVQDFDEGYKVNVSWLF